MNRCYFTVFFSISLVACEAVPHQRIADDAPMRIYRPQVERHEEAATPNVAAKHPRLIAMDEEIARTKKLIEEDATARQWFEMTRERCEAFLKMPVLQQPRGEMLHTSREALIRITNLAGAYRLTGNLRYAERAVQEMLAVSRFTDWQPNNFLSTAEMTFAVGIGYDWCFDAMTSEEREEIRDAIEIKGLRAGLEAYETKAGWTTARHNWNLVCNGGMIVGALALMDEEPRTSQRVLASARESIRYGMSAYAPDGGWEEGPTYWNYATRYAVFALESLKSSLGTDWGLLRSPGFASTGLFRIYTTGPTGKPFNFADAESTIGNSAEMFWLARAVDRPVYAAFERLVGAQEAGFFDLLFYQPADAKLIEQLPRDVMFRGANLVSLRGAWNDPQATFVAFKGGSNEAHHGHLDLGTFVLDALGERWAMVLGAGNYDLPGYFGAQRWSYYRCSTRGQNTITLDNRNQETDAKAPIINFLSGDARSQAILNLSNAYHLDAKRVMRGFALLNRRDVLVQDEIDLQQVAEVAWSFHTTADVRINGPVAQLRKGGEMMTVKILSPNEARFEVAAVNLPASEERIENLKKVVIRLREARGHVRIAVIFTPGETEAAPPQIVPLQQWMSR